MMTFQHPERPGLKLSSVKDHQDEVWGRRLGAELMLTVKSFNSVLATDRIGILPEVLVWALLLQNMSIS